MSCDIKYIGMDVHKEAIVIAVLDGSGKLVMRAQFPPIPAANQLDANGAGDARCDRE